MKPRGMSLVDVIVGSALVLIVFLALLGLLRASLLISSSAKAKAGATAVATTQMEYLRSLPYDSVGTVGGIPTGPVAQYATTTVNGIPYAVRTLVQYVDDPKDGSGGSDSNGITTDYKRVRVATTYTFRGNTREVALVSNVAPPSIETTTNGGTLRVRVADAAGAPVQGASVRVYNPSLTPSVDVTTFTDIAGEILFPGAATSTGYRIAVTKDGYSSAETYARDATNQNPTPGYLTVSRNQTTTGTFAIDLLSTFVLSTFTPITATSSLDTFDTTALVTGLSGVMQGSGAFSLQAAEGGYVASGSLRSVPFAFSYLSRWTSAAFSFALPAGTNVRVRVYDAAGTLLPDSALPGNASGFTTSPIGLTTLSTTTYPSLVLGAELSTANPLATPQLLDWTLAADVGPVPAPNVAFTLTGAKKKGTTGAGAPIYKTVVSTTTDATGIQTLRLEWDEYVLSVPGRTLVSPATLVPYTLDPGTTTSVSLILQ
jgi:hypothetical protein